MIVHADIRALQDPGFARRGIGSHAAFILGAARGLQRGGATIVGLADPGLPVPPADVTALCDEVRWSFAPRPGDAGLFLALSPMTHDSRPSARFHDRQGILTCAVVYDFIPLHDPGRYLASAEAARAYAARREWLAATGLYLPISSAVGAEVVERLGASSERVAVTGVALRGAFAAAHSGDLRPGRPPEAPRDYVLFVGGPDPRKNLETVVAAMGRLGDAGSSTALVIAGGYPERWRRRIVRLVRSSGRPLALHFLDHVDDVLLAGWYAHARATVVASRDEGFSMPVIEAMACGSPVLASDIPCHRELVEEDRARFDPDSPAELAARLAALLGGDAWRAAVGASQRGVPGRFTAARVAERFTAALEARIPDAERRTPGRRARRRPALAIVSPWPPDRSGVADYTRRTVQALAVHADVDIWTDAPQPVADDAVRAFHRISSAAWMRPDYDATIAVLGNSHFHAGIIDHHLRHGGPCILHDSRLIDLYAWWYGTARTRRVAEHELGRAVAPREIHDWTIRHGELPTLFLSEVVRAGSPVFVHSRGLADEIGRLYGAATVRLPFALLREFSPVETGPEARALARAALGIPADRRLVVTLGIYGPSKAPDVCVDAVARLRARGAEVHLAFVGVDAVTGRETLARARAAGIGAAVHCTGAWLADDTYRAWVSAADAAVQLRTHRFGGISAALMDCVAAGVPTVANDDLAAALDAPPTVHRVPDTFTADDVAAGLWCLLRSGAARDETARRAYCGAHTMATYAEGLLASLGLDDGRAGHPASRDRLQRAG